MRIRCTGPQCPPHFWSCPGSRFLSFAQPRSSRAVPSPSGNPWWGPACLPGRGPAPPRSDGTCLISGRVDGPSPLHADLHPAAPSRSSRASPAVGQTLCGPSGPGDVSGLHGRMHDYRRTPIGRMTFIPTRTTPPVTGTHEPVCLVRSSAQPAPAGKPTKVLLKADRARQTSVLGCGDSGKCSRPRGWAKAWVAAVVRGPTGTSGMRGGR